MIRRLRKRLAVLLAPGLVGRVWGLTVCHGRHGVACCRTVALDRTDIGRHRQLLEQQAKKRDKRLKKIDEEIAALEERIASAERERERNDLLLCSEEVFRDGTRVKKIQQQNSDLKAMIDLLYGKWEALSREKEGAAV